MFCDFETLLRPLHNTNVNDNEESKNVPKNAYQKHEVYSAGYFLHCTFDKSLSRYDSKIRRVNKTEDDVTRWLSIELLNTAYELDSVSLYFYFFFFLKISTFWIFSFLNFIE